MRIGEVTYTVLFCGAVTVALLALIVVVAMIDRRWRNQEVPKARVVVPPGQAGAIAAKARPLVRAVLATAALLGATGSLLWMYRNHTEMIVVTERGSVLHVDRHIQLGQPPEKLPMDHYSMTDSFADGDVWIFNETHRTLRLENTEYGTPGIPSFNLPHEISPGTMAHTSRVDYIGPDDLPPSQITVSETEAMARRTWLTWDR